MTEGDFKEMERSDLGLLTTIPMLLKLLQTKHSDLNEPMVCSYPLLFIYSSQPRYPYECHHVHLNSYRQLR